MRRRQRLILIDQTGNTSLRRLSLKNGNESGTNKFEVELRIFCDLKNGKYIDANDL